jgi:hypothetical protein
MKTMRDCFWLWGQSPGTHHLPDNVYNLPGTNRMTPLEGAYYFGIPNVCRVVYMGQPKIPYDQEAIVLDSLDRVVWSVADYGTMGRAEDGDADVREVSRQARLHPNVTGAIMDDLFADKDHIAKYPAERIARYKKELNEGAGRPMELWVVIYTHEFNDPVQAHLKECDVVSMWTWWAKDIPNLDANLARLRELCGPGKRLVAGCYMWDYGDRCPIPNALMRMQLDKYYEWLKNGEIEGIIFCTNCVADLGIPAADIAREWIRKVGGEPL